MLLWACIHAPSLSPCFFLSSLPLPLLLVRHPIPLSLSLSTASQFFIFLFFISISYCEVGLGRPDLWYGISGGLGLKQGGAAIFVVGNLGSPAKVVWLADFGGDGWYTDYAELERRVERWPSMGAEKSSAALGLMMMNWSWIKHGGTAASRKEHKLINGGGLFNGAAGQRQSVLFTRGIVVGSISS